MHTLFTIAVLIVVGQLVVILFGVLLDWFAPPKPPPEKLDHSSRRLP